MSPILVKALQLFLSLSILIILHELGHFIPAKLFKTRVEKFFLFFDVKFALFKKKIGETVYGIGWLPLGGYVKISGMIDESMDKEQMAQPPQPWEFRSKPAWQRLIIMLGGVTVNLILGFFIYAMVLYVWGSNEFPQDIYPNGFKVAEQLKQYGFRDGDKILKIDGKKPEDIMDVGRIIVVRDIENVEVAHANGKTEILSVPDSLGTYLYKEGAIRPFTPRIAPVLDSIVPDSPAAKAGLEANDEIVSVNGTAITFWDEFTDVVKQNENTPIHLVIKKNKITDTISVTPGENKTIGVYPKASFTIKDITKKKYSFTEAIPAGIEYGYWTLRDYISSMKFIFTKKGATEVGGFGTIAKLFPDTWNWQGFWLSTAFISIILAFMNILPIPALDGGHVMFLLYEMITGRKPSEKFLEYAQMVGFFLLIALLLYANGNDIYKAIFK
ncbi:RIP metalloprotease RseP [Galbibacter pacificus]|uniref:Zinc metalloprotease n=1 Tax=Galbibacter pacificus TaxID=2996052 RepID=A0ABT6FSS3_9FLAO|nr:RIP metalloprotease RseP [Galbibacter pacificus]MDG3582735.1 RIP metalloprotease RseP [Galbibacter pacificus]MDG3586146.1 RIP metalloprotease RseP [Galbibacter pacificus]